MKRFIRSGRQSSSAQSSSASRVTGNGGTTTATATTVPNSVENHPTPKKDPSRMSSGDSPSNSRHSKVVLQLPSPLATITTMTTTETSPCDSQNNNSNSSSPVSSVGSCGSSKTARSLGTGTFSYDGRVPEITLISAPGGCPSQHVPDEQQQQQQSNQQRQRQQQQQQPPVLFLTAKTSASIITTTTVTSNAPPKQLSPSLSSSSSVTISPSQPSPASSSSSPSSSSSIMNRLKETSGELLKQPVVFKRRLSSFLRVADLDLDDTVFLDDTCSEESYPNFSYASSEPPPGMTLDPQERWVALDDGTGKHAPIAPHAIRALCQRGLDSCLDQTMWTPSDGKTAKLLESDSGGWYTRTWQRHGSYQLSETDGASDELHQQQQQVLVWTGIFQHGLYGSDLPAVRAAGWIDLAPHELLDLLVDSSRVQEYNKLSLGRTDELVLQATMHDTAASPFGGITKVVTSESRPPLLRKTLRFTSILHARELHDHSGYIVVTRAVTAPAEEDHQNNNNGLAVVGGEILMGVNLIKRMEGCPNSCILITVNHIRSPLVPMMIAKRIGLTAAVNFVTDVRKVGTTTATTAASW